MRHVPRNTGLTPLTDAAFTRPCGTAFSFAGAACPANDSLPYA